MSEKYEMHVHTAECDTHAHVSARDIVRIYKSRSTMAAQISFAIKWQKFLPSITEKQCFPAPISIQGNARGAAVLLQKE